MNVPVHAKSKRLSLTYGDERIVVEHTTRPLSGGKVLIKVHPDLRVVASAPEFTPTDDVLHAVKKRTRWIYQQLRDFRQQLTHITPRQYVSGESHYYLGKQYVLKVLATPTGEQGVKLLRGKLEVSVPHRSAEQVHVLLAEWYKARAAEVFAKRLDAMLEQALWVTMRPPIRLLSMQTQWGSCSPNGRLTLNPHLVKAPRACIDYVILHELCHIAEHNHSDRFYRLLNQVMPTWQKTKQKLDGMAHTLLAPAAEATKKGPKAFL
jgi:predicted metal-dependent hydrolase